jgi:excinuclease UvrABC helicase subunit UvrB
VVIKTPAQNMEGMIKKNRDKLVQDVIKSINWNRIKYFHHAFGIKWQYQEKEGYTVERFPTIGDLKDELKTLLQFAIEKNTPVLDYGHWIILWNDEESSEKQNLKGARLEAIFSLEDSIAIDSHKEEIEAIDNIKKKMEEAAEKEDYEGAAKLRDKLNYLSRKKKDY